MLFSSQDLPLCGTGPLVLAGAGGRQQALEGAGEKPHFVPSVCPGGRRQLVGDLWHQGRHTALAQGGTPVPQTAAAEPGLGRDCLTPSLEGQLGHPCCERSCPSARGISTGLCCPCHQLGAPPAQSKHSCAPHRVTASSSLSPYPRF